MELDLLRHGNCHWGTNQAIATTYIGSSPSGGERLKVLVQKSVLANSPV
jgi:hypothetical protein